MNLDITVKIDSSIISMLEKLITAIANIINPTTTTTTTVELNPLVDAIRREAETVAGIPENPPEKTETPKKRSSRATGKEKIVHVDTPATLPEPTKVVEQGAQSVTLSPEGDDSFLAAQKPAEAVTKEDLLKIARAYVEAGAPKGKGEANKARIKEGLVFFGCDSFSTLKEEHYAGMKDYLMKLVGEKA